MKAIETVYNGYRFRSRLEARWAVFFDAMKIKYEYEPEGFEAKDYDEGIIRYLPDFYLPDSSCYVEIKPNIKALMRDEKKLSWMIDYCSSPISEGLLILGQIPYWEEGQIEVPVFPYLEWHKGIVLYYSYFGNKKVIVDRALSCLGVSSAPFLPEELSWFKNSFLLDRRQFIEIDGMVFEMDQDYKFSHSYTLREAFLIARQARFEYGEAPITTRRF